MSARAARREEARARRAADISRFIGQGRFDLEALTAPEFERQRAVWEASGPGGGLSAGGAQKDREVRAKLRGEPGNPDSA
jgi:hypothetical protein